jgi:hypothetical protein
VITINDHVICHWSKLQSNIVLSSGEAELNCAVKCISEMIGVFEIVKELYGIELKMLMKTDTSACKGMLLRHEVGRVEHLTTKQLWCQGAVESYGIKILKTPRYHNWADLLTHGVTYFELRRHLRHMGFELSLGEDRMHAESPCPGGASM